MQRRSIHVALLSAFWVLVVGGTATFAFFYVMTLTRWFSVNATELVAWRNGLVLQYTFVNATTGKATPLLSNTYSFILIWQWCGTLTAALGAAGLLYMHSSETKLVARQPAAVHTIAPEAGAANGQAPRRRSLGARLSRAVARVRRLLRWQVPPRGLWRALLGPDGLSLLDLLLILIWLGLHILWLSDMTMKVLDPRRARSAPSAAKGVTAVTKTNTTSGVKAAGSASLNATITPPNSTNACTNASTSAVNATRTTQRLRSLLAANNTVNSSNTSNTTRKTTTTTTSASKTSTVKPLPREVKNSLAKYTGLVGNFDLLLLFFPLPRCNFLHWVLGTDFPAMVKYHRWLGHATLLLYSLHGIIYMALWIKDGTMSANMQWSMGSYVNNIAGLISLIGGWVLWVTSIPFIRRRLFNLFYASHIGGTVVFMLFAMMHRKDVAPWIMPGIFLYLLDVVLRTIQQAFNATLVSAAPGASSAAAATLSPHGSVLTLTIQCDKMLSWAGLDIVFLNVPEISWWQWHPFTLATSSVAGGPETNMVLHIKAYNRWTQRLVARLATNPEPVKLYVSGPYHGAHRQWITNFDRHIFVAGGIGVTPVFAMLQDLIARRRAITAATGDALPPAGRVSLIWITRSRDELGTLPVDILLEATRTGADAWLDFKLYLTANEADAEEERQVAPQEEQRQQRQQQQQQQQQPTAQDLSSPVSKSKHGSGSTAVMVPVNCLAAADSAAVASFSGAARASIDSATSDTTATIVRPLAHPYMFSPLLWAAAATLCFAGGFAGFICSQAYEAHISRTVAVRNDYTHVGMLQFAALGLGAALPPALLMLVVHVYWEVKSRRSAAAALHDRQHQYSGLYDNPAAASTSKDSCRVPSALHPLHALRLSVTSTATSVTDDASGLEHFNACSLYDKSTGGAHTAAKPPCAAAKPSTTTGFRSNFSSVHDYSRYSSPTEAEPYIKYGRPDLPALLEGVSRTGGGPLAEAAPPPPPLPLLPSVAVGASQSPAADVAVVPPALVVNQAATVELILNPNPNLTDVDLSDLRVAVFVAGPVRLVEAVEEVCAQLNGPWGRRGRCYLEAHPLTHEL